MRELKCKICGGKLEFKEGDRIAVCDSCGTKQILPELDNERKINLFDRADHFLRLNEYDRAMNLYEQVLLEDSKDALAYWSLVLCRYGVEYVEDPKTERRIPTIHRLQVRSLLEDDDYKKALENADEEARSFYEEAGHEIEDIRKQIWTLSQKETPYDVFICYKEKDQDGNRTQDSVLANELYYELKEAGYKVFFSRITLENKLGENYESCIFSALHSAKVMVVIGTKAEYLNSVWVKNEWSRYLELIRAGEKKTLIPAYRDMDPYDLPEEFSHLQAQDMSKLGFMQDLLRGIEKICTEKKEEKIIVKKERILESPIESSDETKIENLIRRIEIFLEYEEWKDANQYCEKALDQDPENATVYLYKIMANVHVKRKEDLAKSSILFDDKTSYEKLIKFADPELANEIKGYAEIVREKLCSWKYAEAMKILNDSESCSIASIQNALELLKSIKGYKDSDELAAKWEKEAERLSRNAESSAHPLMFLLKFIFGFILFLFLLLLSW